jgi:hypothetical protein
MAHLRSPQAESDLDAGGSLFRAGEVKFVPTNALRWWCFAVWCLASICSIQGAGPKHQDGVMLEATEYDWCQGDCAPFNRSSFFYCVKVSDKVLIGSRKADWSWMYDSSQMMRFQRQAVSLRYNDDSIWIVRTDGKEMRLAQDYSEDFFTDSACVSEVHRRWLHRLDQVRRPGTVSTDAVLIPTGLGPIFSRTGPYFWASCRFEPHASSDRCTMWNEKGAKYKELDYVDSSNHAPVAQVDLVIDPLTTKADSELHLRNGIILK